MADYMNEYQRWLDSPVLSDSEWKELNEIADNEAEIKSRFYAPLEFGTAGLRGIMGLGINRMNEHVVKHATQAFAALILKSGPDAASRGVIICNDCRINSDSFARAAACVMAANGIQVKLFDALRPTPELSFAIRHYKAVAGINVTASHNTKEYNGYKVYWEDGAQLPPQYAKAIADEMAATDIFNGVKSMDYDEALAQGLITVIGTETDELFLAKALSMSIDRETVARVSDDFKVVYTPFHGAGYQLVPEILKRLGIKHIFPVPEQMVLDGAFPTVKSPNPENPESFAMAVELARKADSDLIIGTDPDSDRVGVMVRDAQGEYVPISGNQMGVLLMDYMINAHRKQGTLPENSAVITTIVSTKMVRAVADANGIHMDETFTGFKFIAEKLAEYQEQGTYEYLMGFEESYGYMIGEFVRDKDAVTASMLIAEMAAVYHSQGMTLLQALDSLYEKYGCFAERTLNLVMPGIDGLERMKALMAKLSQSPPREISETSVVRQRDYNTGKISVPALGVVGDTEISGSNVLYFELEDNSSFIIRPSGTEPKIKIYILVSGDNMDQCNAKLDKYENFAKCLDK